MEGIELSIQTLLQAGVREFEKGVVTLFPKLAPPKTTASASPHTQIPTAHQKQFQRLMFTLDQMAQHPPPIELGKAVANKASQAAAKAQENWAKPTTKRKVGNVLIGVTALCAVVAIGGLILSGGGIAHIQIGNLSFTLDVSTMASIAFYSGVGALMGFQLRKQAKLIEKEREIQGKLEEVESLIALTNTQLKNLSGESAKVEREMSLLLETAKSQHNGKLPTTKDLEKAIQHIEKLEEERGKPLEAARTDGPTLPLPKKAPLEEGLSLRLKSNQTFQERLTQIYKPTSIEAPSEKRLKKIALLAGIGFIAIFGVHLYGHFGGHLPSFLAGHTGLTVIAMTTILMYGVSLVDLGLSSPEKAEQQAKITHYKQAKQEAGRMVTEVTLANSRLEALNKQLNLLKNQLEQLEIEVDVSRQTCSEYEEQRTSITEPTPFKPSEKQVVDGALKRELGKPGFTAHLTKGVMIASAIVAIGGAIYAFTGHHTLSIFGNVTQITPLEMGMVAFYSIAITAVAQQVLAKMQTQAERDAERKEVEDLRRKTEKAEKDLKAIHSQSVSAKEGNAGDKLAALNRLVERLEAHAVEYKLDQEQLQKVRPDFTALAEDEEVVVAYGRAIQKLELIERQIDQKLASTKRLKTTGHLFQRGTGVVATVAGIAILAYLAFSLMDRTGAARLFLQGANTNLVATAILASNGFATLYAGITLWQNGRIKERQSEKIKAEKDLEARLLKTSVSEHRNHLIQERELYSQLHERRVGQNIRGLISALDPLSKGNN